jgi:hypothetical protein
MVKFPSIDQRRKARYKLNYCPSAKESGKEAMNNTILSSMLMIPAFAIRSKCLSGIQHASTPGHE